MTSTGMRNKPNQGLFANKTMRNTNFKSISHSLLY